MCLMKSGLLARVTDLNSVKHCCNNLGCLSSYVRARRKEMDMEGALRQFCCCRAKYFDAQPSSGLGRAGNRETPSSSLCVHCGWVSQVSPQRYIEPKGDCQRWVILIQNQTKRTVKNFVGKELERTLKRRYISNRAHYTLQETLRTSHVLNLASPPPLTIIGSVAMWRIYHKRRGGAIF